VTQEWMTKRHIRRDRREGRTYCGRPVRDEDVKLSRFFRELEVLPRESKRRAEFLASMCETCTRHTASVARH